MSLLGKIFPGRARPVMAVPPVLDARAQNVNANPNRRSSQMFDQINPSRLRASLPRTIWGSKIIQTPYTRLEALAEARFLYENVGLVRAIARIMARYSVPMFPLPISDDENWNQAAEQIWEEWCKLCDVTGMFHFNILQQLLSESMDRDGDVGLLLRKGLKIQLIEGHRIGNRFGQYGDLDFVDGVKYTKAGQPLAYRVLEYNENQPWPFGGTITSHYDIPASSFILLFEPSRIDQGRGLTSFYHALNHIKDIREIIGFEKSAVKNSAAWAAVYKTADGTTEEEEWSEDETAPGTCREAPFSLADMEGGMIPVIGKDEALETFEANRPGKTFEGFLELLIRDSCIGHGLPFEFVWNSEQLGGTVTRLVLAQASRRFAQRQELFKHRLLNRLWAWVIADAIQSGKLTPNPKWMQVMWQGQADVTVDNGRDANADRADFEAGLMTEEAHYALRGINWVQARKQRLHETDELLGEAKKLADTHQVPLELVLNLMSQRTPNGTPPAPGQAAEEDKQKGNSGQQQPAAAGNNPGKQGGKSNAKK